MRGVYNVVTALDVANNFIRCALNDKKSLSPMKLQKLIYFVYARFYAETQTRLFSELFGTWKYGPVLDTVYQEFKKFRAASIDRYYVHDNVVTTVDENSSEPFKAAFHEVWDKFKDETGLKLSQITHRENSAWFKAYTKSQPYLDDNDIAEDGRTLLSADC